MKLFAAYAIRYSLITILASGIAFFMYYVTEVVYFFGFLVFVTVPFIGWSWASYTINKHK